MFCCQAFENLIKNAGERGFSAVIENRPEGLKFSLQMRAVEFASEADFSKVPLPEKPSHISLSGSMRIRYCPSCGKRLENLVAAKHQFFKELAVTHEPFKPSWVSNDDCPGGPNDDINSAKKRAGCLKLAVPHSRTPP